MMRCCKDRSPDTNWSWVVCISAALSNLLHYGFNQSFGVFLPILSDHFKVGRERTAWVGSLSLAFNYFVSPFAVRMTEKFGHRTVAIAAGLGCAISLITSSFANNIVILYFSHGLVFGLSAGSVLNTGYTITSKYFKKKRALATGLTASGISIGVMIMNPIAEKLVEVLGWRNTFRVMAGAMLLICLLASTYSPIEVEIGHLNTNQQGCLRGILGCTVFKDASYAIGVTAIFLTFFGLYVPIVHLVRFALDLDISSKDASYLFIFIGITSTISRIVTGRVIDKKWLTAQQIVQLSSFIMGNSVIFFSLAKEYIHFIIFSVMYGITNGAFITAQNVFLQSILKPEKSAIGLGMGYMTYSVAVCAGPPFVGFLADVFGSYIISFYVIGGLMVFAAVFPFLLQCPRCKEDEDSNKRVEVVLKEIRDITKEK